MATGPVFTIIANDGKSDKLLNAQEVLSARIRKISCDNSRAGRSPVPMVSQIEQSHLLFFVAHYKPFATFAFEYTKTRPTTGGSSWGSSGIQYSIPVFGDFFADMVINLKLAATSATVGVVPALPGFVGPDDQVLTATKSTSALRNTTTGVYTQYVHEYVDLAGNVQTVGAAASNFVRYCEFPGQRVLKKVKFEVNNSPLDEYNANTVNFFQKFKIQPNKMTGYKRLVGQEVPVEGQTDLLSISGASNYSQGVDLLDVSGGSVLGAPVTAGTTCRKVVQIVNGPQTPKATQPAQSWWIKLLFWFCEDFRLSVPSIAIPYGQRYITIDLEDQSNVLFVAPGNLFARLTVSQQTSAGTNRGLATALAVSDVKTTITKTPVLASGSVIDTTQKITDMNIYINNIYTSSEIHDVFIKSIGFTLIRVHLSQSNRCTVNTDRIRLSKLKWPIETLYIGMRPTWNIDASNPNQYRDWHRFTRIQDNVVSAGAQAASDMVIDNTIAFNAASNLHKTSSTQIELEKITYPVHVETIDWLQLEAHGSKLYQQYDAQFYRDYLSYNFGGDKLVTPEDPGALMITFCIHPGIYQPSGYINLSRARETDLEYYSSYITPTTQADLIIEATAINFLVIADGSATLRYTT